MNTYQTKEQLAENASDAVLAYLHSIGCEKDGHLLEHLYNLTLFRAPKHKEYYCMCWGYKNTCIELLALLTDPEISGKLPEYMRKEVGSDLKNMLEFFGNISDGATEAAMDLEAVDQYADSMTEDEIERIKIRYTNKLHKKKAA